MNDPSEPFGLTMRGRARHADSLVRNFCQGRGLIGDVAEVSSGGAAAVASGQVIVLPQAYVVGEHSTLSRMD